jgi:DNA polymerase
MVDPDAARRALAARATLALRAERAMGLRDVRGINIGPATAPERPAVDASVPEPQPKPPKPTAADDKSAMPAVDLFGNAKPAKSAPAGLPAFDEPPPSRARRIELLQAMDDQEVTGCTKCPLCENRTHTVFGEGDAQAKLMFIGEGPGENEDLTGRPFVGKAGQKLEEMIKAMGLSRESVYIANVVKCRPPGNRVPTAAEVSACTPYLHRQIEWIRPRVIVTLGLPATKHLLGLNLPMGKMRGRWHEWRGVALMPTYHPAYLLRSYTPANRRAVWEDLQQVMGKLAE